MDLLREGKEPEMHGGRESGDYWMPVNSLGLFMSLPAFDVQMVLIVT